MRIPVIAGNWKMNMNVQEASDFAQKFILHLKELPRQAEVVLFPPFTSLSALKSALGSHASVKIGGQNMHWASEGAFTGEISGKMLKESGCEYVIIGHSERRQIEDNLTINKKIASAINEKLRPILCIGETLHQREAGTTSKVIETQLSEGLKGFEQEQVKSLIIAYEPVWAIGTGKTAKPEEAQNVHKQIREWIGKEFGDLNRDNTPILYGGSVKPQNAGDLLNQEDIDGALVGGASLHVDSFCKIINAINK